MGAYDPVNKTLTLSDGNVISPFYCGREIDEVTLNVILPYLNGNLTEQELHTSILFLLVPK